MRWKKRPQTGKSKQIYKRKEVKCKDPKLGTTMQLNTTHIVRDGAQTWLVLKPLNTTWASLHRNVCVLHRVPPQCLSDMGVLCYCSITLMALLTEASFSPAWSNSNGLRFDFPQGQGRREQTDTHSPGGYWGKGGTCREEEEGEERKMTTTSTANMRTQWSHGYCRSPDKHEHEVRTRAQQIRGWHWLM